MSTPSSISGQRQHKYTTLNLLPPNRHGPQASKVGHERKWSASVDVERTRCQTRAQSISRKSAPRYHQTKTYSQECTPTSADCIKSQPHQANRSNSISNKQRFCQQKGTFFDYLLAPCYANLNPGPAKFVGALENYWSSAKTKAITRI